MIVHLSLLIIIFFLCTIHYKKGYREHLFLPISIFLLACYLSFMYDYGLDYWNYYEIFYKDPHYGDERIEPVFWNLFFSFPNYYSFIFFYGIVLSLSVFYVVKYHIPLTYYGYFFLIFFLHPSLCLNMTFIFRSTLGACIIWIGMSLFYLKKVNIKMLYLFIFVASLCHHTIAICLLLPLFGYVLQRVHSIFIFVALVVALWIGLNNSLELFTTIIESTESFDGYAHYGQDKIRDISLIMIASRSLHLIPAFFILRYRNTNDTIRRLCAICMMYYFIYFIGFDLLGRFTIMLFIFVIICTTQIAEGKSLIIKMSLLLPSLIFAVYRNVMFYNEMAVDYKGGGNMMEYKTIFSIIF